MKTQLKTQADRILSQRVAGEDLSAGDYAALFTQVCEVPSYMWDRWDHSLSPHELVRLKFIPGDAGQPLKVIGVSLPFVYAAKPDRTTVTIDTRRTQIVRLAPECAKEVWKQMRGRTAKVNPLD